MLLIAFFAFAATARADEKTTSAANARFETLKRLAGDWVEVGKDGKPTDKLVSSIRTTAAGSVVQETLFPDTDHEMVTMYHLDGGNVVLTHFCILGNQPRMRAEPGESKKLVFRFIGGTNLKSEDEHHMNQATLTILGDDHFQAEWVSCKDGKACHTAQFDLVRKPK
jgi:hypothetical protein